MCVFDHQEPQFEVGVDVAKVFNGKLYRGFILDIDEDAEGGDILYHIEYEDEDTEDLNVEDCAAAVKLQQDLLNGVVNEWTIGDE